MEEIPSPFIGVQASSGLDLQALRVEFGSLTDSGWAHLSPAQNGAALGGLNVSRTSLGGRGLLEHSDIQCSSTCNNLIT